MYSGITQGLYPVTKLNKTDDLLTYSVKLSPELCQSLSPGCSISVNGVCQTLVEHHQEEVTFQAMKETLEKTTLGELALGQLVSIERSLRWGDEMGGHEVAGHVIGTGRIHQKIEHPEHVTLTIQCPPEWMKFIFSKGFIAVEGSSLTVGDIDTAQGWFQVHLVPETIRLTLLGQKQLGDRVNIELDHRTQVLVETVERLHARI